MEKEKSIAKLITKKDKAELSQVIRDKASAAPYSQPLQNLLHQQGEENHFEALEYQKNASKDKSRVSFGCIVLSSVSVAKKKKSKASSQPIDKIKDSSLVAANKTALQAAQKPIETQANSDRPLIESETASVEPIPTTSEPQSASASSTQEISSASMATTPAAEKTESTSAKEVKGTSEFSSWLRKSNAVLATERYEPVPNPNDDKTQSEPESPPTEVKAIAKPEKMNKSKTKKSKPDKDNTKTKAKGQKKKKSKVKKNIQRSIEEREEVFSEALADLYAEQGHHKKAIKMYEKLSLINPEKSSFFAPLIEKLKKKIK